MISWVLSMTTLSFVLLKGKWGMDISIDCTSGLTIGDISGVGGGCSDSISELVSRVFIDSVKIQCVVEVGFSPTLSITCVRTCSKNISAPNQCWSSALGSRSGCYWYWWHLSVLLIFHTERKTRHALHLSVRKANNINTFPSMSNS